MSEVMTKQDKAEVIQDWVSKNCITELKDLQRICEQHGLDWSDDVLGQMGWNCCDRCGALGDSELDLCWVDCIDWDENDEGDKNILDAMARENVDYCALCWNCIEKMKGEKE